MCGLFGAFGNGINIATLRAAASAQVARGSHAFGVAWIDADGRLHAFKSPGSLLSNIDVLDRCAGAIAVVGHTRFATHGTPADNANNHPHQADGGWLCHNGVVPNHEEIADEMDLLPMTECDSEVLGLSIAAERGSLGRRVARTVDRVSANAPLAVLALWSRPHRLVVARRGNPLVSVTRGGCTYLGSVAWSHGATEIPDGRVTVHNLRGGAKEVVEVRGRRSDGTRFAGSDLWD